MSNETTTLWVDREKQETVLFATEQTFYGRPVVVTERVGREAIAVQAALSRMTVAAGDFLQSRMTLKEFEAAVTNTCEELRSRLATAERADRRVRSMFSKKEADNDD